MTAERRARWRKHFEDASAVHRAWERRGYPYPPPATTSLPADLVGLECGARTRAGTPCKRKDLELNGRCKLHGGLSTGPRTERGRLAAKANLAQRWPVGTP